MIKQIYHRVFQLGNENSDSETKTVSDEEKSVTTDEELQAGEQREAQSLEEGQECFIPTPPEPLIASEDDDESDDDLEISANKSESDDDEFVEDDDFNQALPLDVDDRSDRDRAPVLPKRAVVKSAKEFFNTEFVYHFDILEDEDRKGKTGKYRFELKGFQGGIWSVDLGEQMEVVNRREDAEIVFTMQQKDFVHVVNGDINPQLAILAKKLRITGDMRKAISFLDLLVPGGD